jgi:hypothetical protein
VHPVHHLGQLVKISKLLEQVNCNLDSVSPRQTFQLIAAFLDLHPIQEPPIQELLLRQELAFHHPPKIY